MPLPYVPNDEFYGDDEHFNDDGIDGYRIFGSIDAFRKHQQTDGLYGPENQAANDFLWENGYAPNGEPLKRKLDGKPHRRKSKKEVA